MFASLGRVTRYRVLAALSLGASLCLASAAPAAAENPRLKDFTGTEKPATLVPDSSSAPSLGLTTLTASNRYTVSGVNWASSRNEPQQYVLGLVKDGDVFDVTNANPELYRGGFSYRAHCGFILNSNLLNLKIAGADVPCASSNSVIAPSQFIGVANCSNCGTYTTGYWASAATSATACRNLIPPPPEITTTNHAVCRDPVTIYKGDQIGWRYATKDWQWIAIKDTSRFNDNNGPWMFLKNDGTLYPPCHTAGCWTP